ncbi:MAG: hypothetical protein RMI01_09940 [Thermodesulfovibrio sp.]|nr:hypothetical protein [Thermodesulfovibrio sp.]
MAKEKEKERKEKIKTMKEIWEKVEKYIKENDNLKKQSMFQSLIGTLQTRRVGE